MSDIHIGKSPYNESKKLIKIQIYFHVPNNKLNNTYPGLTESLDNAGNPIPVSVAPGVTAQELIDLKSGDLCEVQIHSKLFNLVDGVAPIKTKIRAMWQAIADKKQVELNNEYPFYGITLQRGV